MLPYHQGNRECIYHALHPSLSRRSFGCLLFQ
jgi:hypothetical protein